MKNRRPTDKQYSSDQQEISRRIEDERRQLMQMMHTGGAPPWQPSTP